MQVVLTKKQIDQKITRLAYEILENAHEEKRIYLAGICGSGIRIAQAIQKILTPLTSTEIIVFEITVDKFEPLKHPITASIDLNAIENQYVVLIDDVLNSGKTMQYALTTLLDHPLKAIKTLALVDRHHHRFPIKTDYTGILLSTTLKERVEIDFSDENYQAVLV
jgi:pyrimidine operon attenuation protein / uracil phosphoribosyltransferase